jgi:hypothetical protein
MALLDLVFGVLRCVVFIYDIVTFPVYSITQQSWKERTKQNLGNVSSLQTQNQALHSLQKRVGVCSVVERIDVMILKIFSPKNSAKKIGVFDSKQS